MGESLNGFEGKTVLRNVQTKSGNRFPVGLAVVACGAEPNLDLSATRRCQDRTGPRSLNISRQKKKGFML